MSQSRQHPAERLLHLARENAKLLWRIYDLHLSRDRKQPDWWVKAMVLFDRAMEADARIWRIHELRMRRLGRRMTNDEKGQ